MLTICRTNTFSFFSLIARYVLQPKQVCSRKLIRTGGRRGEAGGGDNREGQGGDGGGGRGIKGKMSLRMMKGKVVEWKGEVQSLEEMTVNRMRRHRGEWERATEPRGETAHMLPTVAFEMKTQPGFSYLWLMCPGLAHGVGSWPEQAVSVLGMI